MIGLTQDGENTRFLLEKALVEMTSCVSPLSFTILPLPLRYPPTCRLKIRTDNPRDNPLTLDHFIAIECILVAMAIGKEHVVTFVESFRVQIVGQLGFALFEVAAITAR